MIGRIWHGWTTEAAADTYEALLKEKILPDIAAMKVPGYQGVDLCRRPLEEGEVEFVTIMWFDSLASVKAFVGEDHEVAHVPPEARALLTRFDARSQHYEIRHRLRY